MDGQNRIEEKAGAARCDSLFAVIAAELGAHGDAPDGCTFEDCLADLENVDLSEAEKRELIAAVWIMVDTLLRIEFGLDPTQQIWGQSLNNPDLSRGSMLELKHSNRTTFDRASAFRARASEKESR